MELFKIGFLTIRLVDIIDVLLVATLFYQLYKLIRGSMAMSIFMGIMFVYLLWLFVRAIKMELLGAILGQFIGVGVIALIIVFQQEVRRFLILLGTQSLWAQGNIAKQLFNWKGRIHKNKSEIITPIVKACKSMSMTQTGALIVIAKSSDLTAYASTGDILEATPSKRLLESIFSKNSPLHDGAVIIVRGKIMAARCVIPITDNHELPARFGLRHRAAIGITEQSDAIAIVVSEETGEIAYAKDGVIKTDLTGEGLEKRLEAELN